jgi:two-component sensor histidine kinase
MPASGTDAPDDSLAFAEDLRALHEIALELATSADAESLCRRAVEWGIGHLGFDRLSIWFLDPDDPDWNLGTWGTDEKGRLRDERGERVRRDPFIAPPGFYEGTIPVIVFRDAACFDDKRREVGRSDKALAPLWDGRRIIGEMSADNLFTRRPIGARAVDLLTIHARTVAHLYSLLKAKEALAAASEARLVLLGELKHRTKNSLAVIAGLIGLEAERARDAEARTVLLALGDRVEALGSLYSMLEVDGNSPDLALDDYLAAVATRLARGHGADSRGIALRLSLEPLRAESAIAAPLGLALGELVTDCLKHAFPEGRRGSVTVALRRRGKDCELEVSDDGIGLPPGFDPSQVTGLGLGLAAMLARQLHGRLETRGGKGARFILNFPWPGGG